MYKWAFLSTLCVLVPILASVLRQPRNLSKAGFALGLLPFFLNLHLYSAPYAWLQWPGSAKGIEVSVLDAIAMSLVLATRSVRMPLTLKIAAIVYFLGLLVSTALAIQVVPAIFYLWQVLRVMLICVAVARATAVSPQFPLGIGAGIGTAVLIQAVLAAEEFVRGALQAGGSVGHQNTLGMMTMFAVLPAFSLLLAKRGGALSALVIVAGAVIVLTGASRATIGLFAAGLMITATISTWQRLTGRKIAFAVVAAVALAGSAPVMMWVIERRSEVALESSNSQRKAMSDAAKMIISDYPFGVGANQYVVAANVGGYSDRAGVAWNYQIRSAPVHNSYYLTMAETGLLGLVGLLALLASFYRVGLRALRRKLPGANSDLIPGVLGALITVAAHSAFEWTAMTYQVQSLIAMSVGICVGLTSGLPQRTVARMAGIQADSRLRSSSQAWSSGSASQV